jgi:hypothetical protein
MKVKQIKQSSLLSTILLQKSFSRNDIHQGKPNLRDVQILTMKFSWIFFFVVFPAIV